MKKQILVNVDRRQTRVAIVEDGRLAEVQYEREENVVGNIYLCRVANVVAGLDAAFLDCGIERNVFLHVSDAIVNGPVPPRGRHRSRGRGRVRTGPHRVGEGSLRLTSWRGW